MQCLYGSYLGLKRAMCGWICMQVGASWTSSMFPSQSTCEHKARENPPPTHTLKDRVQGETIPSVEKCQIPHEILFMHNYIPSQIV